MNERRLVGHRRVPPSRGRWLTFEEGAAEIARYGEIRPRIKIEAVYEGDPGWEEVDAEVKGLRGEA